MSGPSSSFIDDLERRGRTIEQLLFILHELAWSRNVTMVESIPSLGEYNRSQIITTISETNLESTQDLKDILIPFDPNLPFKEAHLAFLNCDQSIAMLQDLIAYSFKDLPLEMQEFDHLPLLPPVMMAQYKDTTPRTLLFRNWEAVLHSLVLIDSFPFNGQRYMLDITRAQYGLDRIVTKYEEYAASRINHFDRTPRVSKIGTFLEVLFEKFADCRSDYKLRNLYKAEMIQYLGARYMFKLVQAWEHVHETTLEEMWSLPDDDMRASEASLFEHVRSELSAAIEKAKEIGWSVAAGPDSMGELRVKACFGEYSPILEQ